MVGEGRAFELTVRSTETRPSEDTQRSVLSAMSQRFGAGVEIETVELDGARRDPVIARVRVGDGESLVDVYGYLQPHDLVAVGEMRAAGGGEVVTRKVHEVDRERVAGDDAVRVLGETEGDVLVFVPAEKGNGER